MKALVVEDNEDSRILLENVLLASGYLVQGACNGREGLDKINDGFVPDIIISDILMPEMDGYALCHYLKNDARYRHIPFIFYTATYTDPEDERLAKEMGAARFFIKPMDMDELVRELETVLQEREKMGPEAMATQAQQPADFEDKYSKILSHKLDKKVSDLELEREKLGQSERRFKWLFETLQDNYFFYTYGTDGVFTYVSPSMTTVLGYSQDECLKHYSSFMSDSPVNRDVEEYLRLNMKGVKQPPFQVEVYHQDGTIRQLEVTEEPVFDREGVVAEVEGIAHDITEIKRLEEQLRQAQKMEAVGTLAGGITHDFNNILSAIIGYAELIKYRLADDMGLDEEIDGILLSSKRATDLVNQILTFSRKTSPDKMLVQPHQVLKEALMMLRATFPSTIRIEERVDPDCGQILINPTSLHQIIVNLCTNGLQAMADGKGRLRISLQSEDVTRKGHRGRITSQRGFVALRISDNGCGMDSATVARIFDPYFTTKGVGEGTGLGLSVVHGIVKNSGGSIEVESTPGQGSCFTVYLPISEETELQHLETPKEEQRPLKMGGEERIIVVDDDAILVKINMCRLKEVGYQVSGFIDSREALEAIREKPADFDLLVTDQTMPKLTGEELIAAVHEIRPDMPVILCTGHHNRETEADSIHKYVHKPLHQDELLLAVREVLDKHLKNR